MKIYICDDSQSDLLRLQHYLKKYAQEENLEIEIEEFLTARDMFLAHNAAKEKPVLLFLDIYMNQIDGIEAAKKLREAGIKTSILFTTSSMEHAMEAFQVHADGYLHKPFDYEAFKHAMSKVSGQLQTDYKTIEVRIERMSRKFRVRDICFAESDNHGVQIYCMDNVYRANITMEGLKEQLTEETSFVTCGRSYIINLAYVDSIDSEVINMKNNEMIPIPVRIRKQIREQYQQYLQEN
ncbi:MAG: response regulator transcription factor [Lachnospiraceae bacterium]|nr:response regulator transcription factor [Lachnospiraceae bacterium]